MTVSWCRACGAHGQVGDSCSSCRSPMRPWAQPASRIGLAYRVAGKLKVTKRLAVCIDESDGQVVLHVGAKHKEAAVVTPVDALGDPSDLISADLSPAGRLHYAVRAASEIKHQWDVARLRARADELVAGSLPAVRQLANEALASGWNDLFEALPLSGSEKAWRRAHEAACFARVDDLRAQLEGLPAEGYAARVMLALPFAPAMVDDERWRALVGAWVAHQLPGADVLRRLIDPAWDVALGAAVELLRDPRGEQWRGVLKALGVETPIAPIAETPGWWRAADIYLRGAEGAVVDSEVGTIAGLDVGLLEDLVDAGGLTSTAPLAVLPEASQLVLRARVTPADLTPGELAEVGHTAELARLAFLHRDRTGLGRLDDCEAVRHYGALLDARETGAVDEARLRPEGVERLRLAERALAAVRNGETSSLPRPLLDDPTIWPTFAEQARSGHLAPDAETRASHPAFSHWCDLERLLGLVWEHRWDDAIALGQALAPSLTTERYHDEALNLIAFAMTQVGRHADALPLLDDAMGGSYTEALLVNTGHTAARVGPELAIPHLARLVREAPTQDLRANALRQAVGVWLAAESMPTLPSDLAEALETVLTSGCSFDDYVLFTRVGANVAPVIVTRLPEPDGERRGPYRIQLGRARLKLDDDFFLADLAETYVAVAKQFGRTSWFDTDWADEVDFLLRSVAVDFGEAGGSAEFIDTVNTQMPELFTRLQRFLLVAQAGAHLATVAATQDATLDEDGQFPKFFFLPIEEFLAERHKFDDGEADAIAGNFHLTLAVAGLHHLRVTRDSTTAPYNALVQRLRWDSQNAFAIRRQMLAILDKDAAAQTFGDRIADRLRRLAVGDDTARERLAGVESAIAEWRAETVKLRSQW
jgi:hypothetical protein